MILLISPAKTLDFKTAPKTTKHSSSVFISQTKKLTAEMKKLSTKEIAKMMKVSEKIAALNHERYQNFKFPFTLKNSKQAILAFQGDVYRDIDTDNYSSKDFDFAQDHLRILSGLYGLLKPLDLIQPYRLEMKYKTDFWKDKITPQLNKELKEFNYTNIINLASNEYFKPINKKELQAKLITCHFQTKKDGQFKTIPIFSKIARGTMTNWIIKNRVTKAEQLPNFQDDKWKFSKKLSTNSDLVFTR